MTDGYRPPSHNSPPTKAPADRLWSLRSSGRGPGHDGALAPEAGGSRRGPLDGVDRHREARPHAAPGARVGHADPGGHSVDTGGHRRPRGKDSGITGNRSAAQHRITGFDESAVDAGSPGRQLEAEGRPSRLQEPGSATGEPGADAEVAGGAGER